MAGRRGRRSWRERPARRFRVADRRKASSQVSDDLPNLISVSSLLERGHGGAELLAPLRDGPQQILVDRDRLLHQIGKERGRRVQRVGKLAVAEPRVAMTFRAIGHVEGSARGNRIGRVADGVLGFQIFLGELLIHEGGEAKHALLLLRAQILEVPPKRHVGLRRKRPLRKRARDGWRKERGRDEKGSTCKGEPSRHPHGFLQPVTKPLRDCRHGQDARFISNHKIPALTQIKCPKIWPCKTSTGG